MLMSLRWIIFLWVIGLCQSYDEEEIVPIDCKCSEDIDSCRKNGTCESEFGEYNYNINWPSIAVLVYMFMDRPY